MCPPVFCHSLVKQAVCESRRKSLMFSTHSTLYIFLKLNKAKFYKREREQVKRENVK